MDCGRGLRTGIADGGIADGGIADGGIADGGIADVDCGRELRT